MQVRAFECNIFLSFNIQLHFLDTKVAAIFKIQPQS